MLWERRNRSLWVFKPNTNYIIMIMKHRTEQRYTTEIWKISGNTMTAKFLIGRYDTMEASVERVNYVVNNQYQDLRDDWEYDID